MSLGRKPAASAARISRRTENQSATGILTAQRDSHRRTATATATETTETAAQSKSVANDPRAGIVLLEMTSPLTAMVGVPMPCAPGWIGVCSVIDVTNES